MKDPRHSAVRTFRRDRWEAFLKDVPLDNKEQVLDWIFPGPKFDLLCEFPGIDPKNQKVFEGSEAVDVLKEFLDNYYLGKFLGPFPGWVKTLDQKALIFIRTFIIKKTDSSAKKPKNRVLLNASEELDYWEHFQPDPRDPDFVRFRNSKPIKTWNDALIKYSCSLPAARSIIEGFYKTKLIFKMDCLKGFRHLVRSKSDWHKSAVSLKVGHPDTGEIWETVFVETDVFMGASNSPCTFHTVIASFVKGMIFHYPELFGGKKNYELLRSFIDDFMIAAGQKCHSRKEAHKIALQQLAMMQLFGDFLGIKFLPTKMMYPKQSQTLLGLVFNTLYQSVALKMGKAAKFAKLIKKLLNSEKWDTKELQSFCGNLIWVSNIIPKLNGFASPIIELLKHFKHAKSILPKKCPALYEDCIRVLNFVLPIIETDPSVHVKKFLGKLKLQKPAAYSDASGFEFEKKNPTPGTLACLFPHPKASFAFKIEWHDLVKNVTFSHADKQLFNLSHARPHGRPSMKHPSIAFLEFSSMCLNIIRFNNLNLRSGAYQRRWIRLACDNTNSVGWLNGGRCPFFPFSRLSEFVVLAELRMESTFSAFYVKSEKQLADGFTRGETKVTSAFVRKNGRKLSKTYICKEPQEEDIRLFLHIITGKIEPKETLGHLLSSLTYPRGRYEPPLPFLPAYLNEIRRGFHDMPNLRIT